MGKAAHRMKVPLGHEDGGIIHKRHSGNAGMTANVKEACKVFNVASKKLKIFPVSDECCLAIKLALWCHQIPYRSVMDHETPTGL